MDSLQVADSLKPSGVDGTKELTGRIDTGLPHRAYLLVSLN